MTSRADTDPGQPAPAPPGPAAPVTGAADGPLLPERSPKDTDAAWGEYPERADDRLYRDRPPHWANF